ncbi:hypothetical protein ACJX0J_014211, partial [Zea mays]
EKAINDGWEPLLEEATTFCLANDIPIPNPNMSHVVGETILPQNIFIIFYHHRTIKDQLRTFIIHVRRIEELIELTFAHNFNGYNNIVVVHWNSESGHSKPVSKWNWIAGVDDKLLGIYIISLHPATRLATKINVTDECRWNNNINIKDMFGLILIYFFIICF